MFGVSRLKRPLNFALVVLCLLNALAVPVSADGRSIDYRSTAIRGVHVAMDARTAYAVFLRTYGKGHVKVEHTVCFRDYVSALNAHKASAPMNCIATITGENANESLSARAIEDVADRRFGRSLVMLVVYSQTHLDSDADHAAFRERAITRFGTPDEQMNPMLAWCSNLYGEHARIVGCSGDVMPFINVDTDGQVRPNHTPYGYARSPYIPEYNYTITAALLNGQILIVDYLDQAKNIAAFSRAVNPQSTKITF